MLQIGGSYLEGGGQIVRTALALSVLLQKPVEITDIRKGRSVPGLKNQHLFCIKALQQLCNAKLDGAFLGSEKITFIPDKISASKIKVNIETAGSITLLLQSLLLPCILTNKRKTIEIIGGTDVKWSPQIDYFREIIIPLFARYVEKIELKTIKRGYYPAGQGQIQLKIKPKYDLDSISSAQELNLVDQGKLLKIKGISHASKDLQSSEVAERQAKSAALNLSLNVPVSITSNYSETASTSSGITLWAICSDEIQLESGFKQPNLIGIDELGEKGISAEIVGKRAAEKLIKELSSKAALDKNAADNIIPLLAFVKGTITSSEITDHLKTNIYVVEKFIGKRFEITNNTIKTI